MRRFIYGVVSRGLPDDPIAVGLSIIGAILAAESLTGDPYRLLHRMGYRVVEYTASMTRTHRRVPLCKSLHRRRREGYRV